MFTTYGAIRSAGEREGYGELEMLVCRDIYINSPYCGVGKGEYALIVETDATQYVGMINRHWENRLTK